MTQTQPSTDTTTQEPSSESLISDYIVVVNQALDKSANEFPLKQVMELFERFMKQNRRIGVAIYSSDAHSPHDYFTLRLNDANRIELANRGKENPDVEWKVSKKYLKDVTNNPEPYIKNPVKLDWEWLKSRFSTT